MFRIFSAIRIRSLIAAMMWGGISGDGSGSSGNENSLLPRLTRQTY